MNTAQYGTKLRMLKPAMGFEKGQVVQSGLNLSDTWARTLIREGLAEVVKESPKAKQVKPGTVKNKAVASAG